MKNRLLLPAFAFLFFVCLKGHSQSATDTTHKHPITDTTKIISGRLPGFFPQQKAAKPGKDASNFSMSSAPYKPDKSKMPLIIVDGKKSNYKKLKKIKVNNILSITILKDSATTAKYGRKARNGVLLIATRKSLLSTDTAVRNRIGRDTTATRAMRNRMQQLNPANSQNEANKTPASSFIK
jgi:TonB-dependent SusC/RagA subfamily outer membrane receptor